MVKRAHKRSDEIMLVPFLDILCSLIGVLVLIIVVMCVSQTQKVRGRTVEEVQRAGEYQKMKRQMQEKLKLNEQAIEQVTKLEHLQEETRAKAEQVAKIRKLLDTSTADREKNKDMSLTLLKELDNLLLEVSGLKTQEPPLKKQLADLQAEIAKRKPPAIKGAPVIVQPGGSGLAKGSKAFFVEASAGKLTFYWDGKTKGVVTANADVLAVDEAFNSFLKGVLTVPQSKIIFLLRDDGMTAFNLGAGWAQATYGYQVSQIGRLPIPGRGEVDLQRFKEFLGTLPPPPEVKPAMPPAPAPKATPEPVKK